MPDRPTTIIVAHGSPSDPDTLDSAVQALAARVQEYVSDRLVIGATLAKVGSLESALAQASGSQAPAIYPFFMSEGWFVKRELRRRVELVFDGPVTYFSAFGLDPKVPGLCSERAISAAAEMGATGEDTVLVMAAHGSQKGPAAAEAAEAIAQAVRAQGKFAEVRLGFVEQTPTITEAASGLEGRKTVCLPLCATTAGHVLQDVPEQLDAAGFTGKLLQPIGEDQSVPHLIAATIRA